MSTKKIGIIDVGGGMRGVYGAGLFDYLMDNEIWLPYCVGISAGSANVASYLSRQRGRNKVSYEHYSFQREYMSFHNLLKKGSYVDLDYVYGTLSNSDGTYPWDYDAAMENPAEMIVVATDAKTAQPVYFTKKDFIRDDYGPLKGSSCIPIACRAYRWRGRHYYDGAITDPIPVERAFADHRKETGVTVHYIDSNLDAGTIIAQRHVPIYPDDTVDTLETRVHETEHELYPETVKKILTERIAKEKNNQ